MANSLMCCSTSVSLVLPRRGGASGLRLGQYAAKPGIISGSTLQACWSASSISNSEHMDRLGHKSEWRHGWWSSSMHEGGSFWNRQRTSHQMHSQSENSVSSAQPASSSDVNRDSDPIVVKIVEDNEQLENTTTNDQFKRLATAMATNDDEIAEQVMQEIGNTMNVGEMRSLMDDVTTLEENLQELEKSMNGGEMRSLMNGVSTLEENLRELYAEVNNIIEGGDEKTAREILAANYQDFLTELEEETPSIEQAAMLDIMAQLRLSLGDHEEAEDLLTQIKGILGKLGPDTDQALLDNIWGHMKSMYSTLGKPFEDVTISENSQRSEEDLPGEDSPLMVQLLMGLASTYSENEEHDKALATYQRAVEIVERTSGMNDERLAHLLAEMGHLFLVLGRFVEAEAATVRALDIVKDALGLEHWQTGGATCALARVKVSKGDYDEAVFLYRKGLQVMERARDLPEDDAAMAAILSDFSELLDGLERYSEAQDSWKEALRKKEREVGVNSSELSPFLEGLATSFSNSEKYDEAETLLWRSLKLVSAKFGPVSPEISKPMESLASVLHHLEKDEEAEPFARQALHIRESSYGPLHPSTGEACNTLASICYALNKYKEALELMQRVLTIEEKENGPDSPEVGMALELQILILEKLDRRSEWLPLLQRMEQIVVNVHGQNLGRLQ